MWGAPRDSCTGLRLLRPHNTQVAVSHDGRRVRAQSSLVWIRIGHDAGNEREEDAELRQLREQVVVRALIRAVHAVHAVCPSAGCESAKIQSAARGSSTKGWGSSPSTEVQVRKQMMRPMISCPGEPCGKKTGKLPAGTRPAAGPRHLARETGLR
eukprot:3466339-Prymnesium_polylepis.2